MNKLDVVFLQTLEFQSDLPFCLIKPTLDVTGQLDRKAILHSISEIVLMPDEGGSPVMIGSYLISGSNGERGSGLVMLADKSKGRKVSPEVEMSDCFAIGREVEVRWLLCILKSSMLPFVENLVINFIIGRRKSRGLWLWVR
ncbi:hypothetical protein TNCV_5047011 [Trichonephila clavipes]|nr:hypothetical protein TNCV_5047011 [Trichonephila clavipes]